MGQIINYNCLKCGHSFSLYGSLMLSRRKAFECDLCREVFELATWIKPLVPDEHQIFFTIFRKLKGDMPSGKDGFAGILDFHKPARSIRFTLKAFEKVNIKRLRHGFYNKIPLKELEIFRELYRTDRNRFFDKFIKTGFTGEIGELFLDYFEQYRIGMEKWEAEMKQLKTECPDCHNTELVPWNREEAHCPKCGEEMKVTPTWSFLD